MKKILLAFLTSALILTAAGCGEEKKEEANKDGKVTQVAFQAPEEKDTTNESVEYLKTQVPLFAKYLETRMAIPLTFETETTSPDFHGVSSVYIRDEASIATSVTDETGNEIRTIYMDGKVYVVMDKEKAVYSSDYPEENIKKIVENSRLKIDLTEAQFAAFETGAKSYKDNEYKFESIWASTDTASEYYFDQATDELKYIVTGDNEVKVLALSNSVNEDKFSIPSDYKTGDLEEYFEKFETETPAE